MATFQDKLAAVLEERGMSNRGLAKLIDPDNMESARRTIRKWLSGKQTASQSSRDTVTDALGLEQGSLDSDDEEDSLIDVLLSLVDNAKLRRALDRAAA